MVVYGIFFSVAWFVVLAAMWSTVQPGPYFYLLMGMLIMALGAAYERRASRRNDVPLPE